MCFWLSLVSLLLAAAYPTGAQLQALLSSAGPKQDGSTVNSRVTHEVLETSGWDYILEIRWVRDDCKKATRQETARGVVNAALAGGVLWVTQEATECPQSAFLEWHGDATIVATSMTPMNRAQSVGTGLLQHNARCGWMDRSLASRS